MTGRDRSVDGSTDVFDCLAETIDTELRTAVDPAETARLRADGDVVRRHSRVADQQVTYGLASFCRECGEPAPCPTIRSLAERYGCDVP